MRKKKILVAIEHADGTAGVFADRAGRWRLSGYLEDRGGTRLKGFRREKEGLDGDRFVHGGRLPPGATSAVIEDAAGREHADAAANGAWVAITDAAIFARFPVRFTADDGEAIEVPGGIDRGRGFNAVLYAAASADPGPEAAARDLRVAEKEEERERREDQRVLERVRFPVYVVPGRPAELAGWGSSGRKTTGVKVLHGSDLDGRWLRVESQRQKSFYPETEEAAARFAFEILELTRAGTRAAARADLTTRSVQVDGKRVTFTAVAAGDGWAAVGRAAEDTRITMTARGVPMDGLELVTLDDPLSLLSPAT